MNMLKHLTQHLKSISYKGGNMDFSETVLLDDIYYHVTGDMSVVDDSFSHAFGVERGHHFEVDNLKIQCATDIYGEFMLFDNSDEDMLELLSELVEDKLNES